MGGNIICLEHLGSDYSVSVFVKEVNSRGDLELETGKLIFHSKNCHVYERQYKLVKELLSPQTGSKTPRMAQTLKAAEEDQQREE